MLIETAAIGGQAMRGRASHFNGASALDSAIWQAMMATIVVATVLTSDR